VVCDGIVGDGLPDIKRLATKIFQRRDRCMITLPGRDHLEQVLVVLRAAGGKLVSIIPHKESLEEIFLEYTNRKV